MKVSSRTRRLIGAAIALPVLAVAVIPAARESVWELLAPRAEADAATVQLEAVLADRELHVTMPDGSVKTYPIAVGSAKYPTPTGSYTIKRIVWNPAWVPPNSPWARGERPRGPRDPANPMKVAKLFFREPVYYIHGTGHVGSLGTAASHGCIRMHPDQVAELGALVMEAGGVAHDWDWVKRTLRVGETRTVNLKRPVRMSIVPRRAEPEPATEPVVSDSTMLLPVPLAPDTASAPTSAPEGGNTVPVHPQDSSHTH